MERHVAGTIGGATYGVAKSVRLVAVRVLTCAGTGLNSAVIAGVDWVTGNHQAGQPAVANMSLGGGKSAALEQAVANSIADGVTYGVAAGNETEDACTGSPSGLAAAITVGATENTDARASYSDFGPCVDLLCARLEHHVGLLPHRYRHGDDERHIDGDAARRGRRCAVSPGRSGLDAAAGPRRALQPDDEEHRHGRPQRERTPALLEHVGEWAEAGTCPLPPTWVPEPSKLRAALVLSAVLAFVRLGVALDDDPVGGVDGGRACQTRL